ncbi:hypothetical protein Ccrd_014111 [Cynara cardunculus var. scolymus]|uniref:Uncharacterized protein n=1 Tax=Cynara cardunculus var. scolymus TaxID=59895 RepID=A0A103YEF7_CYNCS|nr:hypothetical protein Ccrd_014111 [Cynara cardunculus var. scolymus]
MGYTKEKDAAYRRDSLVRVEEAMSLDPYQTHQWSLNNIYRAKKKSWVANNCLEDVEICVAEGWNAMILMVGVLAIIG